MTLIIHPPETAPRNCELFWGLVRVWSKHQFSDTPMPCYYNGNTLNNFTQKNMGLFGSIYLVGWLEHNINPKEYEKEINEFFDTIPDTIRRNEEINE